MWPTSQNPYPIYDHNLRYSLPYFWPDQNFETLFMTWSLHQNPVSDLCYNWIPSSNLWRALICWFFLIMMEKWLLGLHTHIHIKARVQNGQNQLKSIPYSWPKQLKPIPFGAIHTYIQGIWQDVVVQIRIIRSLPHPPHPLHPWGIFPHKTRKLLHISKKATRYHPQKQK